MHGRLKVKTSAEQAEAKRLEREKKVKLYTGATQRIFHKRRHGELDQELIDLTGQILGANPDFYTLWNIRREVFLQWTKDKSDEEMSEIYGKELVFLEGCLHVNPKGYGIWQHRCWVMDTQPKPDWARELTLCNKYLEFDERNFHCWDYRRFVVQRSHVSAEKEFEYTTAKINANLSNYSSWHYRSKLLPVVHPDPAHPVRVQESVLLEEFELAQNAFFTDPNDQSAWFYHRWLLGRGDRGLRIECAIVNKLRCIVVLSKHIQVSEAKQIQLSVNAENVECEWSSLSPSDYSKIYEMHWKDALDSSKENKIAVQLTDQQVDVTLSPQAEDAFWRKQYKQGTRFSYELSATTSETLTRELESCQQLDELEPENKWTLLTIVLLMRAIDPLGYESQMTEYLDKLQSVDSLRKTYYQDLKCKCLVENAIERMPAGSRSLDLSGLALTSLPHLDHLCHVTHLKLRDIKDYKDRFYLQCIKSMELI